MTAVNQIFEDLAANNSRLFKLDYLKQHQDNEVLRRVIFLALDPFTQFYIRKIPEYKQIENTDIGLGEALDQLGYLSNRIYTGNKGIEHLRSILCNLPADKAKVIERIIKKDLKCGASVSTVNEIWSGLIHEYPCMLCSGYEEKLVDKIPFPAYAQLKLDGMRFNAIVRSGEVEFKSRNGKDIELLGFLENEFKAMAGDIDLVFDGELVVVDDEYGTILDRQTGNGILNKASKGTISSQEASRVHATVWDAIPYEYFKDGEYNRRYAERFSFVENCVRHITNSTKVKVVPNKTVNDAEEANELFAEYYASGEEGIILKSLEGIWENKRSKHQIKYKGELECDLKIVGLEEGSGKYHGKLGSLLCESGDGIVKVSVGSGLTDEHRSNLNSTELIGRICAVKYNARIKNKQGEESLFLPIFIEVREDKTEADKSEDIK
jgi:hypothetical protein